MIDAIACPTDFSPASETAFEHALRLAVALRTRLDLLHVHPRGQSEEWGSFPHVREKLAAWRLIPPNTAASEIEALTGIRVRKIEVRHRNPISGIIEFIGSHRPNLLVVATHGSAGFDALRTSVAQDVMRHTHLPTLFLGPLARPFVLSDGQLVLRTALIPVADKPSPVKALQMFTNLFQPLNIQQKIIHVSENRRAPQLDQPVQELKGPVVDTILRASDLINADLIAMATAGRDGFLDALRGSTTERVLREAKVPLLALPS